VSEYQFKHENKTFKRAVSMEFSEDESNEIVRNFYYFLLAVSFNPITVIGAFEAIAEEYRESQEEEE
jgi:hypothetical protein